MIAHALTIVKNELQLHLKNAYGVQDETVDLGNIAEGFGTTDGLIPRDKVVVSLVNIREEKALKNLPNYVRNDVTLRATYENPPVFLNLTVLFTATQTKYSNALLLLSRVIRFFQFDNVLTQDNVAPSSLIQSDILIQETDQLESFKLIFDLHSPTMEEVNHLWGTLGGKQYPFVLYTVRMLDLKFKAVQSESGLITEIQTDFYHKNPAGN